MLLLLFVTVECYACAFSVKHLGACYAFARVCSWDVHGLEIVEIFY